MAAAKSVESESTSDLFAAALPVFKALADESRLRILGKLFERAWSVGELALALGLKEPTVSHHLSKLMRAGLLRLRKEGTVHWYALDQTALRERLRFQPPKAKLAESEALEGASLEDSKIIRAYLNEDGSLRQIPATRKKRLSVLRWLAAGFSDGRRYKEAEVNALINQRHWDSATLRRELVMHRMLARERGVYWLLPRAEWLGLNFPPQQDL